MNISSPQLGWFGEIIEVVYKHRDAWLKAEELELD